MYAAQTTLSESIAWLGALESMDALRWSVVWGGYYGLGRNRRRIT